MMILSTQLIDGLVLEKGADIDASVSAKEMPKSAAFIAGQSFAPSPTIAHTMFYYLSNRTT
jgi:hypothetical protein